MTDAIDEVILAALSQNAKQSTFEIWDYLKGHGFELTEEEIESRITKLEQDRVIKGYTISVDLKKIKRRVIRVDLVTFRTSQALPKRLEGHSKYLDEAPFVVFSGKTHGGYDWITVKSFLNDEMADEECDIYRNLFGDIIQNYTVYDFNPQTDASFYTIAYTESEHRRFLKEWAPPFLGK